MRKIMLLCLLMAGMSVVGQTTYNDLSIRMMMSKEYGR